MYEFGVVSNCTMFTPHFIKIRSTVLELKHADGQTDKASPVCVYLVKIVQRTHKAFTSIDTRGGIRDTHTHTHKKTTICFR
jgi:hypothetical protein